MICQQQSNDICADKENAVEICSENKKSKSKSRNWNGVNFFGKLVGNVKYFSESHKTTNCRNSL